MTGSAGVAFVRLIRYGFAMSDDERSRRRFGGDFMTNKLLSGLFRSLWRAWGGSPDDDEVARFRAPRGLIDARSESAQRLTELGGSAANSDEVGEVKILRKGPAMRGIFFYPGEEGTYV